MNNMEDLYELSPMQQGMLFHTLYSPKSEVYFEQLFCILKGDLDLPIFQQSWQQVVSRHPVLRTSFHWEEIEKPLQMVNKSVDWPWICHDWRNLTKAKQQERLEVLVKSDRKKSFDLAEVPLMRFTLIQLEEETYQFIWSHHHILFDGWSMQIILKEVFALYEANSRGESLTMTASRPYRDYIVWLQEQDINKAKNFWQETLKGFEYPTPFRIDKKLVSEQSEAEQNYAEQPFKLSQKITKKLQSLAQKHHLTLNNLVQGAYALLLSRYSGENDIVFGATLSGRPATLDGVESMVGLFINTLPVRVQISGDAELLPWLKDLQTKQIEQEQYAYYSLADIQSISDIPAKMPLFESIFVFENYPIDATTTKTKKALEVSDMWCFERTNYPLTIVINPGAELSGRFVYNTSRFDEDAIANTIAHFQTLLTKIANNPEQKISQFSLLTTDEEAELVKTENYAAIEYEYKCIHELFAEQVEKTPDSVALVYQEQQLTYRELNDRANQLAHYLQTLGVKAEVKVGICVERSLEMVIGILGILKAGGAYLPLDPTFPAERLEFMMEDAEVNIILTQSHLENELQINNKTVIKLDSNWEIIAQQSSDNLLTEVTPENLAYIIYTSGTTGNPKGSLLPHRSFIGFMFGVDYIQLNAEQIWLQHSSISWDALTLELWTPLLYGGRCVLYPEPILTPEDLSKIIQEQNVNILFLTTAFFNHIIDTMPEGLLGIKQLLVGGESISVPHVRRALELLPETQIINGYGPSECTVFTCCYPIPKQLDDNTYSIPIGKPIGDRKVYLLDQYLHRVPIGIPGEIYVGGASVARGYLNQPTLTSEKFIINPFVAGEIFYKTGDLARRFPDGNLEFLGRIDTQVKIRGFRIELEEIEALLNQHSNIKQSVVIVREDESGNKYLVAYLVAKNKAPTVSTLRKFLKTKLPDYMIPATFVFLKSFPLTSTRKINRLALPTPKVSQRNVEVDFVAPRNSTERVLAKIWTEVLQLKKVGIYDNFFELGGHSLLATQVISRLRESFSLDFPLRYLFENPTIAELAEKVTAQQLEQVGEDELSRILGEINELSDQEVKQQLYSRSSKNRRSTTSKSTTQRKNQGESMPMRKKKSSTKQNTLSAQEPETITDVAQENSTELAADVQSEPTIIATESSFDVESKELIIAVNENEEIPESAVSFDKKKRLVVCCDGTWHQLTTSYPTNVLKFARLLKYTANDRTSQLVFYSSGYSSEDTNLPNLIDRFGDNAFKWGIDRVIQDAYRFLCMNYDAKAQDEIYLIGFSRGAYIVRCLAAMIYQCGLLKRSKVPEIKRAYELYRDSKINPTSQQAQKFRQENAKTVSAQTSDLENSIPPIKMLGCWETVGTLGIPDVIPWLAIDKLWNIKYQFSDTTLSPIVENAFHAVAIDEKRKVFPSTPLNKSDKNPNQVVTEVWFSGEHSCVGGGNKEYRGLSDYSLQWMIQKAQKLGLEFCSSEYDAEDFQIKPDPTTKFDNSVTGVYTLTGEEWRSIKSSRIAIHHSVVERLKTFPDYQPENLKPFLKDLLY